MKKNFKFIYKILNNKISSKFEKNMKITAGILSNYDYASEVLNKIIKKLVVNVKQILSLKNLIVCFIFNLNKIRFELIRISIIFKKFLFGYTTPINLNHFWNTGSLLLLFLGIQIIIVVKFLARRYIPHVDFAFDSIKYNINKIKFYLLSISKLLKENLNLVSTILIVKTEGKFNDVILLLGNEEEKIVLDTEIFPTTEILNTLDFNLYIYFIISIFIFLIGYNASASNGVSSEEGGSNPSDDANKPSSSNNNEEKGIISTIAARLYDNRNVIIAAAIGTLVIGGGCLILNHYGILPSISDVINIFRSNPNITIDTIQSANAPTATNQIVAEALAQERFSRETLPEYFSNLYVTAETFSAAEFNYKYISYEQYKAELLENFLDFYAGVNRNVVQLHDISPSNFERHEAITLMIGALQKFPQVAISCLEIMEIISQGNFNEEVFLTTANEQQMLAFKVLTILLQNELVEYQNLGTKLY